MPPTPYDRRQIAWWLRIAFLAVDAGVFVARWAWGVDAVLLTVAAVSAARFLAIGWTSSSLRVRVDAEAIRAAVAACVLAR